MNWPTQTNSMHITAKIARLHGHTITSYAVGSHSIEYKLGTATISELGPLFSIGLGFARKSMQTFTTHNTVIMFGEASNAILANDMMIPIPPLPPTVVSEFWNGVYSSRCKIESRVTDLSGKLDMEHAFVSSIGARHTLTRVTNGTTLSASFKPILILDYWIGMEVLNWIYGRGRRKFTNDIYDIVYWIDRNQYPQEPYTGRYAQIINGKAESIDPSSNRWL